MRIFFIFSSPQSNHGISLIVVYKTAYYSFYLPVACAMMICGIPFPEKEPRFDFLNGGFGGGQCLTGSTGHSILFDY